MEENKKNENPTPFYETMDSIRKNDSPVVDLRSSQKVEQSPEIIVDVEPEQSFDYPPPQKTAKIFNKHRIKIWAFLALPAVAIAIGTYFTIQEIGRKDSQEIFSQDEIKAGIRDNFPNFQSAQDVQTSQDSQKQDTAVSSLVPEENNLSSESEESFSFAIIGDTQYFKAENSGGSFQKAVKSIEKLNPDKVFSTGDLVSGCNKKDCEGKLNSWKSALGTLTSKFNAIQGNHDRSDKNKSDAIWQKVFNFPTNGPEGFSELAYSLDFKNSHFVFLDSEKPEEHSINSTQRDWLEKDLTDNKKDNTFVFFHESAYPVSSKIKESLDADAKERDALWKILDNHNVTAVFSGHEHLNSRRKIDSSIFSGAKNSLYQFIVGNTDAFDHEAPKAGIAEYFHKGTDFMLIFVKGKSITAKVYSIDGSELNSFDFSK